MKKIGIIGAMDVEVERLKADMTHAADHKGADAFL